ncbi:hypothetical protein [Nannocystis pusilla]|uniref:hypothetical protein n=1 Tax=Nannocystis pusilla TaxID=889268 RepID=UPI003DA43C7C
MLASSASGHCKSTRPTMCRARAGDQNRIPSSRDSWRPFSPPYDSKFSERHQPAPPVDDEQLGVVLHRLFAGQKRRPEQLARLQYGPARAMQLLASEALGAPTDGPLAPPHDAHRPARVAIAAEVAEGRPVERAVREAIRGEQDVALRRADEREEGIPRLVLVDELGAHNREERGERGPHGPDARRPRVGERAVDMRGGLTEALHGAAQAGHRRRSTAAVGG